MPASSRLLDVHELPSSVAPSPSLFVPGFVAGDVAKYIPLSLAEDEDEEEDEDEDEDDDLDDDEDLGDDEDDEDDEEDEDDEDEDELQVAG